VLTMEQWVTIRTLKKQNSELGTRQIADLLGVSRNTVKRALRSEGRAEVCAYAGRQPGSPSLRRIHLRAEVRQAPPGQPDPDDLRSKVIGAHKVAFYRYLCTLQDPVKRTFKRYETAPGEQAQFDWERVYGAPRRDPHQVYVFIFILASAATASTVVHSRRTQGSIFEAMEKSLYAVGASPSACRQTTPEVFASNVLEAATTGTPATLPSPHTSASR